MAAVRVGRLRLRARRRDRVRPREDPAHPDRRQRRRLGPEVPQPLGARQEGAAEARRRPRRRRPPADRLPHRGRRAAQAARRRVVRDLTARGRHGDRTVPPVMIVVCNETKMAEMLEKHIAERGEAGPGLVNNPDGGRNDRPDRLEAARGRRGPRRGRVAQDAAERLRELVATVGKAGTAGRAGPLPDLRRHAVRGLGRAQRHPDPRAARLPVPAPLRAGRRPRSAALGLHRPQQARVRRRLRRAVPAPAVRQGQRREPSTRREHDASAPCATARSCGSIPARRADRQRRRRRRRRRPGLDRADPRRPRRTTRTRRGSSSRSAPRKGIGGKTQDRSAAYENFRMQRLVVPAGRRPGDRRRQAAQPSVLPLDGKIVAQVIAEKVEYAPGVHGRAGAVQPALRRRAPKPDPRVSAVGGARRTPSRPQPVRPDRRHDGQLSRPPNLPSRRRRATSATSCSTRSSS